MTERRNALSARARAALLALAVLLALACSVGVTYAYLQVAAEPVTALFTPGAAACSVVQGTDGSYTVYNSGNTPVYVRVCVAYAPQTAGGTVSYSALPQYSVSADGWIQGNDGNLYYVNQVQPGAATAPLTVTAAPAAGDAAVPAASVALMAECIQSAPASAVNTAWGSFVYVNADGTLAPVRN